VGFLHEAQAEGKKSQTGLANESVGLGTKGIVGECPKSKHDIPPRARLRPSYVRDMAAYSLFVRLVWICTDYLLPCIS
jgi:hypothetical protein